MLRIKNARESRQWTLIRNQQWCSCKNCSILSNQIIQQHVRIHYVCVWPSSSTFWPSHQNSAVSIRAVFCLTPESILNNYAENMNNMFIHIVQYFNLWFSKITFQKCLGNIRVFSVFTVNDSRHRVKEAEGKSDGNWEARNLLGEVMKQLSCTARFSLSSSLLPLTILASYTLFVCLLSLILRRWLHHPKYHPVQI